MIGPGQSTKGRTQNVPVPPIKYKRQNGWDKGVITRNDIDRTPEDAIRTGENVMLEQNGTIAPRPGLRLYGTQPTGTVLGQIFEFVKFVSGVPESWLIWMENRSGVGRIIVSKNGGAHTTILTATYSPTAKAHYEQIFGKVLIMNGTNNLSYLDIDTLAITTLTALTTPGAPTGTASAALTSSPAPFINLRYRFTATNSGETAAGSAVVVAVNKLREVWNGTTETVTLSGSRITGASAYNIYVGDTAGSEYFLDRVVDPGTGATWTYVDTGAIAETPTKVAPVGDSTGGPKVTRATNYKGQIYMTGDTDNPSRIWFGGTGESALDFSSFNGGGWVEPNKGGKDFPVRVLPFRDGKGTPLAICLSKSTNGNGKRYLLQPQTTTFGETVISFMGVTEDNGQDGTDSPDGAVILDDAVYYPSREAFKSTTTRASIQNILSTNGISDNIGPNVQSLSSLYMENCVGLVKDRRIHWALPYASTTNNQMWIADLRQDGAWMMPWYIACDWQLLYADNSDGETKHLILSGNKIYELTDSNSTVDDTTAFPTTIGSGAIKFDENGLIYSSIIELIFIFLRPQGNINVSVTVQTEDGPVTFSEPVPTPANNSVGGYGAYGYGVVGYGNLPYGASSLEITSSDPRVEVPIEIDEEAKYYTWGVSSTESGVSYQLSEVIARHVVVGYKEQ